MKEYKIISESSSWGFEKAKKKIEAAINEHAQRGWKVITVSFALGNSYSAFATLEISRQTEEFV